MGKIDSLSVVAGVVMVGLGLILTLVGVFFFPTLFYGIPMLVIGIVILMTLREQESIEQIRTKEIKTSKGRK